MLHYVLQKCGPEKRGELRCEDSITSSIIGTLQYLPDDILWRILSQASGINISNAGKLEKVEFWPRWSAEGIEGKKQWVEPDVYLSFEYLGVIIEAKEDGNAQDSTQLSKEKAAHDNEYKEKKRRLIALGGKQAQNPGEDVYPCSWYALLNEIDKERMGEGKEGPHIMRILDDAIAAFRFFGYRPYRGMESLVKIKIKLGETNYKENGEIFGRAKRSLAGSTQGA